MENDPEDHLQPLGQGDVSATAQASPELAALLPLAEVSQVQHRLRHNLGRAAIVGAKVAGNVAGGLIGAGVALNLFPYNTELAGVPTEISVSTLAGTGISADTSFGNFEYNNVDGLPVGFHVTPRDINLATIRSASDNSRKFARTTKAEFMDQLPEIERHFIELFLLGGLVGAGLAESVRRSLINGEPHTSRARNAGHMGVRALAGATVMSVGVAGYGAITYNPDWQRNYAVTGLLADVKAVPGKLSQLYSQDTTAAQKVRTLIALEDQLTRSAEQQTAANTAYNVLLISDMHLRNMYPYLAKVMADKGVKMVINTGDESEYGTRLEMTPAYLDNIRAIAAQVPFIWVAGNHDSPETIKIMRSIPGVIVLGDKQPQPDSSFTVNGKLVKVYGLTVAGAPDPRVYGAPGAYGSDNNKETDPLEVKAMDQATSQFDHANKVDIAMSHEEIAAKVLQQVTNARLMVSGHFHHNNPDPLQVNGVINLNQGSAGMGGLDHFDTSPMEFRILSVAPNCQFTSVTEYQLSDPAATTSSSDAQIRTSTFKPQSVSKDRVCSVDEGVGQPISWDVNQAGTTEASGGHK